jgi:hypothetical protein
MSYRSLNVTVAQLRLDHRNPRLSGTLAGHQVSIQHLLAAERKKVLVLAKHIADHGLNPAESFLVMPSTDEKNRFVVLEGNRRTLALSLLEEPKLGDEVLSAGEKKKLRAWSGDYLRSDTRAERVPCVVFDTRDEARPWLVLRHDGEQGGAGIVPWGAIEKARFQGGNSPALQALGLVAEHGDIDDATRDALSGFPITNLERLLADKAVRARLGIDWKGGQLVRQFPLEEIVKGMTSVVRELLKPKVKVRDIYDADDRREFLDRLGERSLPIKAKRLPAAQPLEKPTDSPAPVPVTGAAKPHSKLDRVRKTVIPRTSACNVTQARLLRIHTELRNLSVTDYPNSASTMLRVFLELSLDHYAVTQKLPKHGSTEFDRLPLFVKFERVAEHLNKRGLLLGQELKAVLRCSRDKHTVGTQIATFHEFIHNRHLNPLSADLLAFWDNLQPLMLLIWP